MENVLFKISYPGRVPRADRGRVRDAAASRRSPASIDQIEKIVIETQEAGVRIIDKTGPLANYADRDHCIQYMVAVPLIFGRLTADDYGDDVAADPRIDALRARMEVRENPQFTKDYFDPDKRYIGNSLQVFFKDGTHDRKGLDRLSRSATASGAPRAFRCCWRSSRMRSAGHLPGAAACERILAACSGPSKRSIAMPIHRFVDLFAV